MRVGVLFVLYIHIYIYLCYLTTVPSTKSVCQLQSYQSQFEINSFHIVLSSQVRWNMLKRPLCRSVPIRFITLIYVTSVVMRFLTKGGNVTQGMSPLPSSEDWQLTKISCTTFVPKGYIRRKGYFAQLAQ